MRALAQWTWALVMTFLPRVESYFGKIIAYQAWTAPQGVGEVCIFDNRTVLHASYYTGKKGGYKIGVRYLY